MTSLYQSECVFPAPLFSGLPIFPTLCRLLIVSRPKHFGFTKHMKTGTSMVKKLCCCLPGMILVFVVPFFFFFLFGFCCCILWHCSCLLSCRDILVDICKKVGHIYRKSTVFERWWQWILETVPVACDCSILPLFQMYCFSALDYHDVATVNSRCQVSSLFLFSCISVTLNFLVSVANCLNSKTQFCFENSHLIWLSYFRQRAKSNF